MIGRAHFVVTYVKPDMLIDGDAADQLWQQLNEAVVEILGQAKTEIIIAGKPPYET